MEKRTLIGTDILNPTFGYLLHEQWVHSNLNALIGCYLANVEEYGEKCYLIVMPHRILNPDSPQSDKVSVAAIPLTSEVASCYPKKIVKQLKASRRNEEIVIVFDMEDDDFGSYAAYGFVLV